MNLQKNGMNGQERKEWEALCRQYNVDSLYETIQGCREELEFLIHCAERLEPHTEEEEETLLKIIAKHTTMEITFVKTENNEIKRLSDLLEKELAPFNLAKFHKGSLRNGQKIEFEGSVIVVGDVNPGAEIKAGGNIIILGQLKGMAHAGCKGMTDAFVSAIYMAPVQLRIADIITRFPEENKKGPKPPEYAFVQDGQIFVMALS